MKINNYQSFYVGSESHKQYGENVMVQFSGDALDALKEDMFKEKNAEMNEMCRMI